MEHELFVALQRSHMFDPTLLFLMNRLSAKAMQISPVGPGADGDACPPCAQH
jgi:hypothetical protein